MVKLTKQDILNLKPSSVLKLSLEDLALVASIYAQEANLRVKHLEGHPTGHLSPAYKSFVNRGKPFGTTSTNRQEIIQDYKSSLIFLNLKTSTVEGWEQVASKFTDYTKNYDKSKADRFYDLFYKFIQANDIPAELQSKVYQMCYSIYQDNYGASDDELFVLWQKELDNYLQAGSFGELNNDDYF